MIFSLEMQIPYSIQKLQKKHFEKKGFFETLQALSHAPILDKDTCEQLLQSITQQWTSIFVAIDTQTEDVIGTISVMLEQKFLRQGAIAAHIEDVSVHPNYQKQWIWSLLLEYARTFALQNKAYKIILDCDTKLVWRYAKNWFAEVGVCMRFSPQV